MDNASLKWYFIFALSIRFIFFNCFSISFPDAEAYILAGKSFFETGNFNNYKIMPFYAILAHFSNVLFSIPFIDIVLSAATLFPIYRIAHHMWNNDKIAKIAALIFSLYPFSIFYASSGLTESSFVFFFMVGLSLAFDNKIILTSIFWVLTNLIRPSFDFLFPILIFCIFHIYHKRNIFAAMRCVASYCIVYILLFLPWWHYNYMQYNKFVRLNAGGGTILYEGNNIHNNSGGPFTMTDDTSLFNSQDDALTIDRKLKEAAISFIKEDYKRFSKMAVKKFIRFWNPIPNHHTYGSNVLIIFICVITLIPLYFFAISAFMEVKKYRSKYLPFVLTILYLTAIHMITVASVRYRYPLEPLLIIFASYGIHKTIKKFWTQY